MVFIVVYFLSHSYSHAAPITVILYWPLIVFGNVAFEEVAFLQFLFLLKVEFLVHCIALVPES